MGYAQKVKDLTLGLAYSFLDGRTSNNSGSVESEIHHLSFYAMKEFNKFYLRGIIGGGVAKNDSKRRISTVGLEAEADYQSLNYFIDLELGKNYRIGDKTLSLYLGAKSSRIVSESYHEKGAGVLNLSVDKTTSDSYQALLGLRLAKQYLLDDESTIVTHHGASISREFGDDTQSVSGRFSNGQIDFKSEYSDTPKHHYSFNGGFTWYLKEDLEIQLNYYIRFAEDYLEQSATVDLTFKF